MNNLWPILDTIRANPDDESRWLTLTGFVRDNGEYDLAVVLRHH